MFGGGIDGALLPSGEQVADDDDDEDECADKGEIAGEHGGCD